MSKRVLFFLAEGFEDCEAVTLLSACRWCHYRPHLEPVEALICALHPTVRGRFGTEYAADVAARDADPADFDALVVPGGFHSLGFDEAYCEDLRRLALGIHERGGTVATLCVGVLPVAESGILEGGIASTYALSRNHDNPGRLTELGCTFSPEPVTEWNRIISCSGPLHSEEVARRLLARLLGEEAADELERFRDGRA